ncbi:MAG: hypothetical protein LBJ61_11520 [Deltaproteobacteria bacterium]|jgi:hypothetical protein|nr:hypothetical protein [Deltaproteobacteria bacterium]
MKKLIIPALAIMALLLPSWAMAQSNGGSQGQNKIYLPTADHGKNYQANQKAQKGPEAVNSQPKPVTKPERQKTNSERQKTNAGHQKTNSGHQKTNAGHQKPDLSGKSPIYPGEPGKPATYSGKPPIYPGEPGKPPIYPDNPKSPGANAAHRGKN